MMMQAGCSRQNSWTRRESYNRKTQSSFRVKD